MACRDSDSPDLTRPFLAEGLSAITLLREMYDQMFPIPMERIKMEVDPETPETQQETKPTPLQETFDTVVLHENDRSTDSVIPILVKRRRQRCGRCKRHGIEVWKKDHDCPYETCACKICKWYEDTLREAELRKKTVAKRTQKKKIKVEGEEVVPSSSGGNPNVAVVPPLIARPQPIMGTGVPFQYQQEPQPFLHEQENFMNWNNFNYTNYGFHSQFYGQPLAWDFGRFHPPLDSWAFGHYNNSYGQYQSPMPLAPFSAQTPAFQAPIPVGKENEPRLSFSSFLQQQNGHTTQYY